MSHFGFSFRGRPLCRGGSPSSFRTYAAMPTSPALSESLACSSGVTGNRISMVAGTCGFLLGMGRNHTGNIVARKAGSDDRKCSHNYIAPSEKGSYNYGMSTTNEQAGYFQKNITVGRRVVRITANTPAGPFNSRLYVNGGETATEIVRKSRTLAGAEKQASRMLCE